MEKAALLGHTSAQFIQGKNYLEGCGLRQNKSEAKKWFGLNCDNGDQRGCDKYRTLNEQGVK
jgi:TPR repeat protein